MSFTYVPQVDPFVSVSAAHGVGETVRHQIHESHPEVTEVFIHIGIVLPCQFQNYIYVDVLVSLMMFYSVKWMKLVSLGLLFFTGMKRSNIDQANRNNLAFG